MAFKKAVLVLKK